MLKMGQLVRLQLFSILALLFGLGFGFPGCPDVTPCDCSLADDLVSFSIQCNGNTLENGTHLQDIFSQDFPEINISSIYLRSIGFRLPANVLGGKTATFLSMDCSVYGDPAAITIDPAAFQDVSVSKFHLGSCKLIDSNYDFLGSFDSVSSIELAKVLSDNYPTHPTIPWIPALESLWIDSSSISIWEPWYKTPALTRIGITGMPRDKVLSLMDSFSNYQLETLYLDYDHLKTVPDYIKNQSHLDELYMGWNDLSVLEDESFHFDSSPSILELSGNPLVSIVPGAFQGNFSQTLIKLSHTFLKTIDEEVFEPILQQMYGAPGSIIFEGVRLRCDCSLAWIVRDNPHFLSDVSDAKCSNGTNIQDLDPAGFSHCPETGTTTSSSSTADVTDTEDPLSSTASARTTATTAIVSSTVETATATADPLSSTVSLTTAAITATTFASVKTTTEAYETTTVSSSSKDLLPSLIVCCSTILAVLV